MDQREFGDHAALQDVEWRNRMRAAARADVRAMVRASRRRKMERWLITSMILIAIVAVLMLLVRVGVFDKVLATSGEAQMTGEPVKSETFAFDAAKPFERTPAAQWPDAAAGIVAPPAMQVGEFTAQQVAEATGLVRDILIASRLDPKLLVQHDPSGYLSQLAPDARKKLEPLFGTGGEPQAQALVSLIADDSTLLPVEPKVSGKMWAEAGKAGELIVHTNYVFAYAFEPPAQKTLNDPMDIIVVVRAEVDYIQRTGGHFAVDSHGLWYGKVGGYGYAISCEAYKRGFLAPSFRDRGVVHKVPGRDRDAYFDSTAQLPAESGCPS